MIENKYHNNEADLENFGFSAKVSRYDWKYHNEQTYNKLNFSAKGDMENKLRFAFRCQIQYIDIII